MIDYKKPNKDKANAAYIQSQGIQKAQEPYKEETIEQRKSFLIICEGLNTEPSYFEAFPVPSKTVVIEGGCGSRTALVKYAINLKEKEKYQGREVWCVFDYDIKPDEADTQPEDFNNAVTLAQQQGMKTAWSNDAFELWFVLHYQTLDTALSRHELYPKLEKAWKLESFDREAKTKEFCNGHYDRHGGTKSQAQQLAIKRAKALHDKYGERKDYAKHCPCTTVYQLVEELNKNLKA